MGNELVLLLGAFIRHGLTIAGGAGFVVNDDLVTKVVSAVSTLVGLALSIRNARKKK